MTAQLHTFDIHDDPAEMFAAIDEDGAIIVRDFIDADLLARLRSELDHYEKNHTVGLPGDSLKTTALGARTTRFTGLAAKAPSFAEVIDHDLFHQWCAHAFDFDYWMNTGEAMIVGDGEPNQYLHRDQDQWPILAGFGPNGPEATISIMLALTEFSRETGATRCVPGSHRWEDYTRQAEPGEVADAAMPVGSALLYTGRVLHGAGHNTSGSRRFGVHLSFARGDMTPYEANCLTVPWEIARNYSERVKHMLGFWSIKTFDAESAGLWGADELDVRDQLTPAPSERFYTNMARKAQAVG